MFGLMILLLGSAFSFDSMNIDDYKTYDDISVYRERLDEFNKKNNANLMIPEESANGSKEEIIEFFTSMTLNEFDKYIMSLYEMEKNAPLDEIERYAVKPPKENSNDDENESPKAQNYYNKSSSDTTVEEVLEEEYNSDHMFIDWSQNLPVKENDEFKMVNLE